MAKFKQIQARAEQRKGGAAALKKLLPKVASNKQLLSLGDDRYLAIKSGKICSSSERQVSVA